MVDRYNVLIVNTICDKAEVIAGENIGGNLEAGENQA